MRSSPRGATPSPPLPRGRLSGTSRRSSAMSPLTSSRRWRPLPPLPPWRRPTSFPTVRSSPSATRGSGALRPSSSPSSWVLSPLASTRPPTTPSGRTCTPTLSCLVAPPCTPESLTVCRRRSPPLPPHHEDQDHRSSREEVLRLDPWLPPGFPLRLPVHVALT